MRTCNTLHNEIFTITEFNIKITIKTEHTMYFAHILLLLNGTICWVNRHQFNNIMCSIVMVSSFFIPSSLLYFMFIVHLYFITIHKVKENNLIFVDILFLITVWIGSTCLFVAFYFIARCFSLYFIWSAKYLYCTNILFFYFILFYI